jgi:hypothetical protein
VIYPGEIWGGEDVLGMTIAEGGPPTAVLGYPSEVQGGLERLDFSVSIVQHQTRRGEPSTDRRPGPDCGNDHTVLEFSAMETQ